MRIQGTSKASVSSAPSTAPDASNSKGVDKPVVAADAARGDGEFDKDLVFKQELCTADGCRRPGA